jgi:hypothetical protein
VSIGTAITGTSLAISGLSTASPNLGSHTYGVTSVDSSVSPATESPFSAFVTGSPEYAPSLGFAMEGGALVSQATVEVNSTVQVSPVNDGLVGSVFGNPSGTFTLVGAPSTMSIDPATGLVTYSPKPGESGNVNIQLVCTNPLGASSIPFTSYSAVR